MNNTFFETSKKIANEFLQNIVFIDDRAFKDERNTHEFNALQITKAFAKDKKICAVYKPETYDDINNLALLAKKADIMTQKDTFFVFNKTNISQSDIFFASCLALDPYKYNSESGAVLLTSSIIFLIIIFSSEPM